MNAHPDWGMQLLQIVVNAIPGVISGFLQVIGLIIGAIISVFLAILNLPGIPESLLAALTIVGVMIAFLKKRSAFSVN